MQRMYPTRNTRLVRTLPLAELAREMDRTFQAAAGWSPLSHQPAAARPGFNVWRDRARGRFLAEAEIPGFRPEDLEVTATEDTLTVRGERRSDAPEGAEAIRSERSLTRFERTLRLPAPIDTEAVEASLADGVLRVTLPIAEAARPRRVEVRAIASGSQRGSLPESPPSSPSASA